MALLKPSYEEMPPGSGVRERALIDWGTALEAEVERLRKQKRIDDDREMGYVRIIGALRHAGERLASLDAVRGTNALNEWKALRDA